MAALLPVDIDDHGIATLTLETGAAVVVLNTELLQRLDATLDTLGSALSGLIVRSGSDRVFVAGADLKAIDGMDDGELDRYLAFGQRVFLKLADLPFWTAAAINGAALGGGLELAMHCDGLVGSVSGSGKPYPVGLPEAGLGICPGWGGTNLFPARIDAGEAFVRTAEGRPMTVDEARSAGMFDAFSESAGGLLGVARSWVAEKARGGRPRRGGTPSRWIGEPSVSARCTSALAEVRMTLEGTDPGRAVLRCVEAGLNGAAGGADVGWRAALDAERRELIRLRNTAEARGKIAAFFAKSATK